MGIPFANPGFEDVDVSGEPGAYKLTGAGEDLSIGGWVFEQTAVNYADTVNDFSGMQGEKDWYYGYSTDPSDPDAFSTVGMIFDGAWKGSGPDDTPVITATSIKAPVEPMEAWGVKRWIADVSAIIWISGSGRKVSAEPWLYDTLGTAEYDSLTTEEYDTMESEIGDGLTFTIRKNGVTIYTHNVDPDNFNPAKFVLSTLVAEGDIIDFVVDTITDNSAGDNYEFRASIFSGSQSGVVHQSSGWAPDYGITGQIAMIQGTGRFYQELTTPKAQIKLKFFASAVPPAPLQIVVNEEIVDTLTIDDASLALYETSFFGIPAGINRIAFQGMGDDDTATYIDDVSNVGIYYLTGFDESDSDETDIAGNRGRSGSDLSNSIELACRHIKYNRTETEGSESDENDNLGVENPYIPDDTTIGVNPGVSTGPIYSALLSEAGKSLESYTLFLNGVQIPVNPCVSNVSTLTFVDIGSDFANGGSYTSEGNGGLNPQFRFTTAGPGTLAATHVRLQVAYNETVAGPPAPLDKGYDYPGDGFQIGGAELTVSSDLEAEGLGWLRSGVYTLTVTGSDTDGKDIAPFVTAFTIINPPGSIEIIVPNGSVALEIGDPTSGTHFVNTTVTVSGLPSNFTVYLVHGIESGADSGASPEAFVETNNGTLSIDYIVGIPGRIRATASDLDNNLVSSVTITFSWLYPAGSISVSLPVDESSFTTGDTLEVNVEVSDVDESTVPTVVYNGTEYPTVNIGFGLWQTFVTAVSGHVPITAYMLNLNGATITSGEVFITGNDP